MNEIAFAAYLLETLLHEVFHSKRRMARELDVTLRTLQLNMKAGENSKAANRATLGAVFYCCEHRIDIQGIYDRFVATKKGILSSKIKRFSEISIVKGVRTHPGCISLYPSPRLDKALSSDYNEQGMAHGKEESALFVEGIYAFSPTVSQDKVNPNPFFKKKRFGLHLFGGGEENRTPVRRFRTTVFSERRQSFKIPAAGRPLPGFRNW